MQITWLGHSGIRLQFGASTILIDPFITGAGRSPDEFKRFSEGCTHVLLTHGHDDHVGDTVEICKATGAQLIAGFELAMWLKGKDVENVNPGGCGGTVDCGAFAVSFTKAFHSSSTTVDGKPVYLGNPMGLVVTPKDGPAVYHMGDTDIFGDMALVQEMYRPKIGIVPIGDRFTMGPTSAALACTKFFQFETILPVHWGTFPMLLQSPEPFLAALGGHRGKAKVATIGEAFEA